MKLLGTQLCGVSILESTQASLRLKSSPQVNIAVSQRCDVRATLKGSEIVGKMFRPESERQTTSFSTQCIPVIAEV